MRLAASRLSLACRLALAPRAPALAPRLAPARAPAAPPPPRRRAAATMAAQPAAPAAATPAPPAAAAAGDAVLARLRAAMAVADGGAPVHAFIIPSEDPHMSEYPPDCDARRAFVSGFDGSAGTAVVTADRAALWTDGRYFLQAEQQLGPAWTLMRAGAPGVPEIHDWLAAEVPAGGAIGVDAALHTAEGGERLAAALADVGARLVRLAPNPVDAAWGAARPARPSAPARVHALEWAGAAPAEKLAALRGELAGAGAGAIVVAGLDEVAWLLNLRGADVPHNPVFSSYVIVEPKAATLFVDASKVAAPAVAAHLAEAGVSVQPYESFFPAVEALAARGARLWLDPARVSLAVKDAALAGAARAAGGSPGAAKAGGARGARKRAADGAPAPSAPAPTSEVAARAAARAAVLERPSPVVAAKAVKNAAELAGMREAHLRDGVALARFLCWLEKAGADGVQMDEVDVDRELTARRAAQAGFIEPSFPTIAGSGPNGAVIHYRASRPTARPVSSAELLLIDSGGQYDCGTTDVTRTLHLGEPSAHQRACFTAVLKGHIELDAAVWPEGTPGCALDTLARVHLWKHGLNYRHGTGHGVGAALNVHEGPQSISARFGNTQALLPAMVCSNEPGYYEDGAFGIRIENLFVVVEKETAFRFAGQPFYGCERLTLAPLQRKMIDAGALSPAEAAWVDAYHAQVLAEVGPRLEAEGAAAEAAWLRAACAPL